MKFECGCAIKETLKRRITVRSSLNEISTELGNRVMVGGGGGGARFFTICNGMGCLDRLGLLFARWENLNKNS
jgi:hypothetical protein